MVTVTIGNASHPIRFGDHATPGSGVYEVYLNGQYVPARRSAVSIQDYEAGAFNDSVLIGTIRYAFTIKNNDYKKYINGSLSDWEKLCIAMLYWADNNSVLYYSEKNKQAYNIRQFPKADYSGMETLTVNFLDLIELPPSEENPEIYQRFDCVLKRVKPATES